MNTTDFMLYRNTQTRKPDQRVETRHGAQMLTEFRGDQENEDIRQNIVVVAD